MAILKGGYLVRTKWFRVYLHGSYSWMEINVGRYDQWELVLHVFPFRVRLHRPLN